jgi:hypothetical protein
LPEEVHTVSAKQAEVQIAGTTQGVMLMRDLLAVTSARRQTFHPSAKRSIKMGFAAVRGEIARQSEELAANGAAAEQEISSLRSDQQRDRHEVDKIANGLAVERVNFEVAKGSGEELAPGISLDVTGTDPEYRRVKGWLWLARDRRTI